MDAWSDYTMWTTGTFTVALTISLDPSRTFLITGGLTQTDSDRYAHVYISTVCTGGGDEVLCGVRDLDGESGLNLYEFISGAVSVTIKLTTQGGQHRAEGAVYVL